MKNKTGLLNELKTNRSLFIMIAPAVFLVVLLQYVPMAGLVLAFKNYRYDRGVFGSAWHGFENFRFLFVSGSGLTITRNTFLYNLINLITSQFLAVVIAIIISEMPGRKYKKFCQSVIFLPYFISWVIVGTFVFNIFKTILLRPRILPLLSSTVFLWIPTILPGGRIIWTLICFTGSTVWQISARSWNFGETTFPKKI
jgi:ABC-type polysaccharide transport system permease subunit